MSKYTAIIGEDGEYILQCDGSRIGEILFFHDASHIVATLNRAEQPTPTAVPAAVSDGERAQFEKTMNDMRFFPRELDFSMTKSPSGKRDEYVNTHLQSCWEGWQARAALKAQPAPTEAPNYGAAMPHRAVLGICDAYESGIGHGMQRDQHSSGSIYGNPDHGTAYEIGYEEGKGRSTFKPEVTTEALGDAVIPASVVQGEDSARLDAARAGLLKIIEMNRFTAEHKYGNAEKAESWSCVTVARDALKGIYPAYPAFPQPQEQP